MPACVALVRSMFIPQANDGSNQAALVHAFCQFRKQLTDFNARYIGSDGLELAAYLRGGVHLQIERILVRSAAAEVNLNNGLVF